MPSSLPFSICNFQFAIPPVFRLPPSALRLLLLSVFSAFSVVIAFDAAVSAEPSDSAAVASDTSTVPQRPQPKSPRGAAFRSTVLPGWGQFYNGRPVKGGILVALQTASVTSIIIRQRQINRERVDPAQPRRNVFIFTTLGLMFYSAVDAYVDAHLREGNGARVVVSATWDGDWTVRLIFRAQTTRNPP